jgi:hypothetical protein
MKFILAITFFASLALADQTLKITHKPSEKFKICKAASPKFKIKTQEDEDVCDQLKKPTAKGNAVPPAQSIATPNPISAPPTGN